MTGSSLRSGLGEQHHEAGDTAGEVMFRFLERIYLKIISNKVIRFVWKKCIFFY